MSRDPDIQWTNINWSDVQFADFTNVRYFQQDASEEEYDEVDDTSESGHHTAALC